MWGYFQCEKLLFSPESGASSSLATMYQDFSDVYRDRSLLLYVRHLLVLIDRDLVTPTARGDQFSCCWSEIPAIADPFVSLSTNSPLSSLEESLVTEKSELFLLVVGETDRFVLIC